MKILPFFLTLALSSFSLATPALYAESLLPQGNFSAGTAGSLPEEWTGHKQPHLDRIEGSHELVQEDGEIFLRLVKKKEESSLQVETNTAIPAGIKKVTLNVTSRVPEITAGAEKPNRNIFRVGVGFRDGDGKTLSEANPQIALHTPLADWKQESVTYEVPPGTKTINIALMMLNSTGIWEVQAVEVVAE